MSPTPTWFRTCLLPILLLSVAPFGVGCTGDDKEDADEGGAEAGEEGGASDATAGEVACNTLFEALCEAEVNGLCGAPDSGAPESVEACMAESQAIMSDLPGLDQTAADTCAALFREPACDDPEWQAAVTDCSFKGFACITFPDWDSGWYSDSGWNWDSGWGWDSGVPDDTGTSPAGLESCQFVDFLVCFEFEDEPDVEQWCADISAAYGIGTEYSASGCPADAIGTCSDLVGGDFGRMTATGYYYAPDYDDALARSACEGSGGTYHP